MLTFALGLLALAIQDPGASAGDRGDRLVKVDVLADRASIRPGDPFTLAVRLTVEPGWHIYWDNPGDSGLPTRIQVRVPAGFEAGAPRSPVPAREVAEGDIVTYVHRDEVVYLVDVRAPKELAAGQRAAVEVEASWLVCTEACFLGSGKARIELTAAAPGAATAAPTNAALFAAARARLPRPWKELEGAALEWSGAGEHRTLRFSVPGATALELFPARSEVTSLESRAFAADERAGRLTADLRFRPTSTDEHPRLEGVLLVKTARGEVGYEFDSTGP